MRLNNDCYGVMDNACFHYRVQLLVGRVALTVNVVMTNIEHLEDLSTGKLIQIKLKMRKLNQGALVNSELLD